MFDSYALLALFQDEAGARQVQRLLGRAGKGDCALFISVVSLGELLYVVESRRGLEAAQEVLAAFDQLPIETVAVDRTLALLAARMKAATSIGYADCFVGALAQQVGGAIVSGDSDFRRIADVVPIEWLPAARAR